MSSGSKERRVWRDCDYRKLDRRLIPELGMQTYMDKIFSVMDEGLEF